MFELYALLVNICVMLATLAGLGITLYNFTRQQKLTFFERYTARYQHIMENMQKCFFKVKNNKKRQDKRMLRNVISTSAYMLIYAVRNIFYIPSIV